MNQTPVNESNLGCKNLNGISQNNFIKMEVEKNVDLTATLKADRVISGVHPER